MKTVIITGSGRGLGFEMAKNFKAADFNVVLSDVNEVTLNASKEELSKLSGAGKVISVLCNVTKIEDVENLFLKAKEEFGPNDIW